MKSRHTQRGITGIGMALLLGVLAFFVLLLLKLAPVYLESWKVGSALKSVVQEEGSAQLSAQELKTRILRRLEVDDVENITASDIAISKSGKSMTIGVSYEVRIPILGNIDAIAAFDKQAELAP